MSSKVLVVEDNALIASLWTRKLSGAGYDVRAARDGQTARQAMLDWQPDLVLLDVWLPETDGLALCQEWKASALTAATKIVFVSAFASRQDIQSALKAGGDGYVVKSPTTGAELVAKVAQYLPAEGAA